MFSGRIPAVPCPAEVAMLRTVPAALTLLAMGCSDYIIVQQPWVDRFKQAGTDAPADILFVVDNSASMAEEQGRLEDNADALLAVLRQIDIDFQLGVITTDAGAEAELLGGVLHPDLEDLEAQFRDALAVGFDGGRIEWGLQRARDALVHNPDSWCSCFPTRTIRARAPSQITSTP